MISREFQRTGATGATPEFLLSSDFQFGLDLPLLGEGECELPTIEEKEESLHRDDTHTIQSQEWITLQDSDPFEVGGVITDEVNTVPEPRTESDDLQKHIRFIQELSDHVPGMDRASETEEFPTRTDLLAEDLEMPEQSPGLDPEDPSEHCDLLPPHTPELIEETQDDPETVLGEFQDFILPRRGFQEGRREFHPTPETLVRFILSLEFGTGPFSVSRESLQMLRTIHHRSTGEFGFRGMEDIVRGRSAGGDGHRTLAPVWLGEGREAEGSRDCTSVLQDFRKRRTGCDPA